MKNQNELKPEGKKFVNELMNPDQAINEASKKNNLKKDNKDVFEKTKNVILTNDGRIFLSEN